MATAWRRGLNLGAVKVAALCAATARNLLVFADPDNAAPPVVTVDAVIAHLDGLIAKAERLAAQSEKLTDEHFVASWTAQTLREVREYWAERGRL